MKMLTKGYSCAEAGRKKETEMKLGFITSILEDFTYEEMIDFASEHGFECVEVASWKKEKAERRQLCRTYFRIRERKKCRNFGSCLLS